MKAGFERWRKESQEDENTFSLQGKKKKRERRKTSQRRKHLETGTPGWSL